MSSVFSLEDKEYQRHIDPVGDYIEQMSYYLHKVKGMDIDQAKARIKHIIKGKKFDKIRNPKVRFVERQENGDRVESLVPLTDYIKSSVRNHEIMAPTMTTYLHPKVKESLLVKYVEHNIKSRSVAKKAGFAAKAAGNDELAKIKDLEQTNMKLRNNALSGAHVTKSCPIYNRTAHNTLTSNCRVVASFGNANNEKIVSGNRHYYSPHVVYNNIISITSNSNYDQIQHVMDKFQLTYPTVEATMSCIEYSTNLYWKDSQKSQWIKELVEKLTPIERAAFVYTGDLYHLRVNNDAFMRIFIEKLSRKVTKPTENALDRMKMIDESIANLAHQICSKEVSGLGKDYSKMNNIGVLNTLLPTAENIQETLFEYKDFIQAFFTTKNIPSSIAYLPDIVRRSAVTSDTDSTIFTVQNWIFWFTGKMEYNDFAEAIAGTIIFFASQTITHILSVISSNFGFAKDRLHTMAMKSEFYWPVFVNANISKHYMATCKIQEGNVFSELEREIKGVNLKSSNLPRSIIKHVKEMMNDIMDSVMQNKQLSLNKYLTEVANMEKYIQEELLKGSTEFYRLDKVKPSESYARDFTQSPYQRYIFWKDVLEPKYGAIGEPPYLVIKVPTILQGPSSTNAWMATLEDTQFIERFSTWMKTFNKKELPTIYLPLDYVKAFGIPDEIKKAVNTKRIILDLCRIYYILLEMIGFYKKEELLISDMITNKL